MAHIEQKLGRNRCIGDVHRWERSYWFEAGYQRQDRYYRDFNVIRVELKEAGKYGHTDRIILLAAPKTTGDGDGARLDALARYDWSKGKLKVEYCGPLIGE